LRITASLVTDDQLDALQDTLDLIEREHTERVYDADEGGVQETGYCLGCGRPAPCPTIMIITRQRSKIEEASHGGSTD